MYEPAYFEDLPVGRKMHTLSRTVTEADIVNFAGISGDFNPLHMDAEFAKRSGHGSRIAHGALVYTISSGLFNATGLTDGTCVAFLGLRQDFLKIVVPGDTLTLELEVVAARLTSNPQRGVVTFAVKTRNQRGETVQEGEWKLLMLCKPPAK